MANTTQKPPTTPAGAAASSAGPAPIRGEVVPPRTPQTPLGIFKKQLGDYWGQVAAALPRHVDPDRFHRVLLTAVQKPVKPGQSGVLDCSFESIFLCLMNCAALGLEPESPLKHAYLIPRNMKGSTKPTCTLVFGYQGLVKLSRNSGEIESVSARVVHEKDHFDYEFGLHEKCEHKPTDEIEPGPVTHAYCVWRFKDGGYYFDVMTRKEIERIRDRNGEPYGDSPWHSDPEEMAKKTVLRRTWKMVPMSVDMARANAIDVEAEEGRTVPIEGLALPPLPQETPPVVGEGQQGRVSLNAKPDRLEDVITTGGAQQQGETVAVRGQQQEQARAVVDAAAESERAAAEEEAAAEREAIQAAAREEEADRARRAAEADLGEPMTPEEWQSIETARAEAKIKQAALWALIRKVTGKGTAGELRHGHVAKILEELKRDPIS